MDETRLGSWLLNSTLHKTSKELNFCYGINSLRFGCLFIITLFIVYGRSNQFIIDVTNLYQNTKIRGKIGSIADFSAVSNPAGYF